MEKENEFTIHVSVNGVKIPLTIERDEEILYRDAEKRTKLCIDKFRESYTQKTMEETLTLTAYQMAVWVETLKHLHSIEPLAEKLEELNNILEKRKNQ